MRNTQYHTRSVIPKIRLPSMVQFMLTPYEPRIIEEITGYESGHRMFFDQSHMRNIFMCNQYLNHQLKRLEKYLKNGDKDKFNFLARLLLKKSVTFRIYAMQYVLPKQGQMRIGKWKNLYKRVTRLCETESHDLTYKRVWIDKKPGDFGRPLGVPIPEWRIYTHMITRILEIIAENTEQYSDNQHGGRSYRGVLSALKVLSKRIMTKDWIYEFDLKGFFDHINHKDMLEPFKDYFIYPQLKSFLQAKPNEYKLPPIEKDKGLTGFPNPMDFYDDDMLESLTNEEIEYTIETQNRIPKLIDHPIFGKIPKEYFPEEILDKEDEDLYNKMKKDSEKQSKKESYIPILNNEPIKVKRSFFDGFAFVEIEEEIKEEEREELRDTWKDLHLKDQGVPQGSSFGPVLSSLVLGKIMRKYDSLLYMDDGIIFLDKPEVPEGFKTEIKRIGVEIAEEKSRLLNTHDLITQGIKFLGTRWKRLPSIRGFFTVVTETRKGISKPLIPYNHKQMYELMEKLYLGGFITPSKYKLMFWYLEKSQSSKYLDREIITLAERYGFFGKMLSEAMSPETNLISMRKTILEGMEKSMKKIKESKGSISMYILNNQTVVYENEKLQLKGVDVSLLNVSVLSLSIILDLVRTDLSDPIGLSFKDNKPYLYKIRKGKKVKI